MSTWTLKQTLLQSIMLLVQQPSAAMSKERRLQKSVFTRGQDEHRRKRMVSREGILFCWGEIKRRWKRKMYFLQKRTKLRKKNEEFIWGQKIVFFSGEQINSRGKRGKYLEKENVLPGEEEEGKRKRRKLVRENLVIIGFFVSLNFLNLLQRRISFEIFCPTGLGKSSRERKYSM